MRTSSSLFSSAAFSQSSLNPGAGVLRASGSGYLGQKMQAACACGGVAASVLHERVMASISRRMFLGGAAALTVPFIGFKTSKAIAQQPAPPDQPVLLTNLRLFDGLSGTVRQGVSILVEGNRGGLSGEVDLGIDARQLP